MGILDAGKDLVTQIALNNMLGDAGKLENFSIDRDAKRITGRLLLQGETAPINVTISGYELGSDANEGKLKVAAIACERPWVQALAQMYVVGRWIPLNPGLASKLRMVL